MLHAIEDETPIRGGHRAERVAILVQEQHAALIAQIDGHARPAAARLVNDLALDLGAHQRDEDVLGPRRRNDVVGGPVLVAIGGDLDRHGAGRHPRVSIALCERGPAGGTGNALVRVALDRKRRRRGGHGHAGTGAAGDGGHLRGRATTRCLRTPAEARPDLVQLDEEDGARLAEGGAIAMDLGAAGASGDPPEERPAAI